MTFPDEPYSEIGAFADAYAKRLSAAWASVDRERLAQAAKMLAAAYTRRAIVYACGNGGSAAVSNHLVCDHLKGVRTDTDLVPRVVSLSSNIESITAIANDIGYEEIFRYQLSGIAIAGDVLVTISSSGDSENVVRALDWAMENGLQSIAMTGFAGGRSAERADINLHVAADNYGIVEDVHQGMMHLLAQYLRLDHMDPAVVRDRKF